MAAQVLIAKVRRTALYVLVVVTLAALYMAVTVLGDALLVLTLPDGAGDRVVAFVAALAVAAAFQPAHSGLGDGLDRWFWPRRRDPAAVLAGFSQDLPLEQAGVAQRLAETVRESVSAVWAGVRWEDQIMAAAGAIPENWGGPAMSFASGRGQLWIGAYNAPPADAARQEKALLALLAQAETALDRASLLEERTQLQVQQETAQRLAEAQDRALREVVAEIKREVQEMTEAVDACEAGELGPVAVIQDGVKRIEGRLDERTHELLKSQA